MDAIQQMKDELKSSDFAAPVKPQKILKEIDLQFTENRLNRILENLEKIHDITVQQKL